MVVAAVGEAGTISAKEYSTVGAGVEFHIYFPLFLRAAAFIFGLTKDRLDLAVLAALCPLEGGCAAGLDAQPRR